MPNIGDVVRTLAERPGVEAVIVASMDGLPIAHEVRTAGDHDAIAALAATAVRHATRLVEGADRGELRTVALEGERGTVLMAPAGPTSWLLVLVEPDANFGRLLHDLRRHHASLAALL